MKPQPVLSSRTRLGEAQTELRHEHCVLLSNSTAFSMGPMWQVKRQRKTSAGWALSSSLDKWNGIHICFKTQNHRRIHSVTFHMEIPNTQKGKATTKKKRTQKLCGCQCKLCPWQTQQLQGTLRSFPIPRSDELQQVSLSCQFSLGKHPRTKKPIKQVM